MREKLLITGAILLAAIAFPVFMSKLEARELNSKCAPRHFEDGTTERPQIVEACRLAGGRDTKEFQDASALCWEQVLSRPELAGYWWAGCVLTATKINTDPTGARYDD